MGGMHKVKITVPNGDPSRTTILMDGVPLRCVEALCLSLDARNRTVAVLTIRMHAEVEFDGKVPVSMVDLGAA